MATTLSLVAMFDDFRRNRSVLTQGIETEFERFVRFQNDWRRRLATSEDEKQSLRDSMAKLDNANKTLELKLKHARTQLDTEIRKRKLAEQDMQRLEQQISLVRELLCDKERNGQLDERDKQRLELFNSDYQLSHADSPKRNLTAIEESVSLLSDCDISYDKTEEDLEVTYLRSGRKWKRSMQGGDVVGDSMAAVRRELIDDVNNENQSPDRKKKRQSGRDSSRKPRNHRRSRSAGTVITAKLSVAEPIVEESAAAPVRRHRRSRSGDARPMRKCNSATSQPTIPDSSSCDDIYARSRNASPQQILRDLNKQVTPPHGLRRNNSNNNLKRPHTFIPRTSIKPGESCNPCGKRIGFGKSVLKCNDCRALCHERCKDDVPLPCMALINTPNRNTKNLLEEYAPTDRPYIPALVVHCVQEIENRGLEEQGIYRVPGSEKEIRELKEKFYKGKAVPNLSNIGDINVVCGCLKAFFKDLKEPLLTMRLWQSFVDAAYVSDREEAYSALYQAVSELPPANKDTLAYVILHLQRVAESPRTLMNISNLSKVFGPTLVGYSKVDAEPMQMMKETNCGQKVVEALMNLLPDYWENLLNVHTDVSLYPTINTESTRLQTPVNDRDRGSVYESMLGPVLSTTPSGTPANTTAALNNTNKGWLTTPGRNKTLSHRTFFASPTV